MTAPKRSQVLARILANSGADALPAIRAYLRESPATYAQLVEGAQIAQAWRVSGPIGDQAFLRWPLVVRVSEVGLADSEPEAVCHVAQRTDGLWDAFLLGERFGGPFAMPEEARDALDVEARGTGWTLLGGGW